MLRLTYLDFHALFVCPPLALFVGLALRGRTNPRYRPSLVVAFVLALALAYTTPWDNYLIDVGVWYYGEGRVFARIWLAPVEEYLFIVLQPVLATLWLAWCGSRLDAPQRAVRVTWGRRLAGVLAGGVVTAAGAAMLFTDATFYIGAILAWGGPVLALQWGVGWQYLLARWRLVLAGVAGPALYLSAADRIAIESGIWVISETYTTGIDVLGLPIEEGAFFFLTTLFVVQALVLYPWVRERWT